MDLSPIEQQQAIHEIKHDIDFPSTEDVPSLVTQNQEQHRQSFDTQFETTSAPPAIVLTSLETGRSSDDNPVVIHEQIDPRLGQESDVPISFHPNTLAPGTIDENLANNFHDISLESNPQPDSPAQTSPPQDSNPKEDHQQNIETSDPQLAPSPELATTRTPLPSTPISPENKKERSGSLSPALTVQSSRPTPSRDSTLQETSTIASSSTAQTIPSTHSSSVSPVLVISSLESIAGSKEAKKSKELGEATKAALALLKGEPLTNDLGIPSGPNQEAQIVLQPLKLACQTGSSVLMVTALDCIGKLISYSFFKVSENPEENPIRSTSQVLADVEMGDEVTGIICDCFADAACPDASSLLRAVRTVYNIFLLSKSPTNQAIAQGTLTQIVSHVFGRVEKGEEPALRSNDLRRSEFSQRQQSSPRDQDHPANRSGSPVTPRPQSSATTSPTSATARDESAPHLRLGMLHKILQPGILTKELTLVLARKMHK
ncbi:hypothetical protein H4Q26_013373 [Puccinia striiformis f. sp. tritici PST-130]|nr:hypothetical protein H4Q26_013373 [Puccinia striiformis f. sp. tritici PST-130]